MSKILPTGRFQTWKDAHRPGAMVDDLFYSFIGGNVHGDPYTLPWIGSCFHPPVPGSGDIADFRLIDVIKNAKQLKMTYNVSGPDGLLYSGSTNSNVAEKRLEHDPNGRYSTILFTFDDAPNENTNVLRSLIWAGFGPDRGGIANVKKDGSPDSWCAFPLYCGGSVMATGFAAPGTYDPNDPNAETVLWDAETQFGLMVKTDEQEEVPSYYPNNDWPFWIPGPPEWTGPPTAFWSHPSHSSNITVTFGNSTVPRRWKEGYITVQGKDEDITYGDPFTEGGQHEGRLNDNSKNWIIPIEQLSGSIHFEVIQTWGSGQWE